MMKRVVLKSILIAAALGLFGVGLVGGWLSTKTRWPGLHQDGARYSTVIINRANGLGNTYDVFARVIRMEKGNLSFDVHGQLYYPLVALFLKGKDFGGLLQFLHFTNLLTFICAGLIFYHLARRGAGCTITGSALLAVSAALVTGSLLQYLQGRPDHGIVIVLVIFGLFSRREGSPLISGLRIGIVAAMSPLPAYLLGLMTVWSDSLRQSSPVRLIRNALLSAVIALLAWTLLTWLAYPGPLMNLFIRTVSDGTQENSGLLRLYSGFPTINVSRMVKAWVSIKYIPLVCAPFLFTSLVALFLSVRRLRGNGSRLIKLAILIFLIILPGQLWYIVVTWPEIHYSLIGLIPAMLIWSLRQLGQVEQIRPVVLELVEKSREIKFGVVLTPERMREGLLFLLAVAALLPGLGYLRNSLLQPTILREGVDYQRAVARFRQLKGELADDEYILISEYTSNNGRSAVVLDGPPWRSRASVWGDDINPTFSNLRGRFYFTLQDSLADTNIPERAHGYRLIENRLTTKPVKLFGFRLAAVTPGYAYAVYERE